MNNEKGRQENIEVREEGEAEGKGKRKKQKGRGKGEKRIKRWKREREWEGGRMYNKQRNTRKTEQRKTGTREIEKEEVLWGEKNVLRKRKGIVKEIF